jgi:hypothetical protein
LPNEELETLLVQWFQQMIHFADLAADPAVFCDSNFILGIYILQIKYGAYDDFIVLLKLICNQ